MSLMFRRTWAQVAISFLAACTVALIVSVSGDQQGVRDLLSPIQTITILGLIGTVLALGSSIAFGHLLQFVSSAGAQKVDAYHRLQDRLYELDEFLRDKPQADPLVSEALNFSYEMKQLRLIDFPVPDWEHRLGPVIARLSSKEKDPQAQLSNEVLIRLNSFEDLISTIGLMCVRQMVVQLLVDPVIKSFILLSALLLSGIGAYLLAALPSAQALVAAIPTFFAVYSALLFFEIGWLVRKEMEEIVDFVQREPNGDAVLDPIAGSQEE